MKPDVKENDHLTGESQNSDNTLHTMILFDSSGGLRINYETDLNDTTGV